MGRILIVVMACIAAAVGTWFLTPNIQPVGPNPDLPAFSQDADAEPATKTKSVGKFDLLSKKQRYARAEKRVGKTLKYMRKDTVQSVAWFTDQGPDVVEVAMDECYLLVDENLYAEHVQELNGGSDDADSDEPAKVAFA
jgi:hypothetical protein